MKFNESQLNLIKNTALFKDKRVVLQEVSSEFSEICEQLKNSYASQSYKISFSPLNTSSKITRGENLKGLPFLMLDFPQQFSKTEIFSFRLLFWWGNGFTLFLHLKNNQLDRIAKKVIEERKHLYNEGFLISTGGNEWEHDCLSKNYKNLEDFTVEKPLNFIKFAHSIPFNQSIDLKSTINKKSDFLLTFLTKI